MTVVCPPYVTPLFNPWFRWKVGAALRRLLQADGASAQAYGVALAFQSHPPSYVEYAASLRGSGIEVEIVASLRLVLGGFGVGQSLTPQTTAALHDQSPFKRRLPNVPRRMSKLFLFGSTAFSMCGCRSWNGRGENSAPCRTTTPPHTLRQRRLATDPDALHEYLIAVSELTGARGHHVEVNTYRQPA